MILDVDSTEDPTRGNQEHMTDNEHFGKNCFHPLFCFTNDGDGVSAKLRPGNFHSASDTLDLIKTIVDRYSKKLKLFWLRADPEIYDFCEENRVTYFIRLRSNAVLARLIKPYLNTPVGVHREVVSRSNMWI